MSEYTGCNHILGNGIHISLSNPSFLLKYGGKEWLTEWHHYHGPSMLNKKTGDPVKRDPGQQNIWWMIALFWKDQGGKVVDGVGQWEFPPVVEERYRRVNKTNWVSDPAGKTVMRFWKGYESHGEIKYWKVQP